MRPTSWPRPRRGVADTEANRAPRAREHHDGGRRPPAGGNRALGPRTRSGAGRAGAAHPRRAVRPEPGLRARRASSPAGPGASISGPAARPRPRAVNSRVRRRSEAPRCRRPGRTPPPGPAARRAVAAAGEAARRPRRPVVLAIAPDWRSGPRHPTPCTGDGRSSATAAPAPLNRPPPRGSARPGDGPPRSPADPRPTPPPPGAPRPQDVDPTSPRAPHGAPPGRPPVRLAPPPRTAAAYAAPFGRTPLVPPPAATPRTSPPPARPACAVPDRTQVSAAHPAGHREAAQSGPRRCAEATSAPAQRRHPRAGAGLARVLAPLGPVPRIPGSASASPRPPAARLPPRPSASGPDRTHR